MKKTTLFFAALCVAFSLLGQHITTEWKKDSGERYMGTNNYCRGMSLGVLDFNGTPEKVLLVASREGTASQPEVISVNKLYILDPETGNERTDLGSPIDLPSDPVSGGNLVINDVAVTADGKILVSNLTIGAGNLFEDGIAAFKVYLLDSPTAAPTLALYYATPTTGTVRVSDYITVTGSISDGTAKIYATNLGAVYCWSMSDADQFDSEPEIIYSGNITGNMGYFDFLPGDDLNFLYSSINSGALYFVIDDVAYQGPSDTQLGVPGSARKVYFKYIATEGKDDEKYGAAYFAFLSVSTSSSSVPPSELKIAKLEQGWNNDPAAKIGAITIEATSESLGANTNGNGSGKIVSEIIGDDIYIYALATNNGIGKFKLSGIEEPKDMTTTGVKSPEATAFDITVANNMLSVSGIDASSITLYNMMGQEVKSALNANQLSVNGLRGIYVVRVTQGGAGVKTAKVLIF